jgi:hypothetical protein
MAGGVLRFSDEAFVAVTSYKHRQASRFLNVYIFLEIKEFLILPCIGRLEMFIWKPFRENR